MFESSSNSHASSLDLTKPKKGGSAAGQALFAQLAGQYEVSGSIRDIEDLVLAKAGDLVAPGHEDIAAKILGTNLFNYSEFAAEFLKIIDTKGREVSLKLNKPQRMLEAVCQRELKERGLVRIICLKARREGVSTWKIGRMTHGAIFTPFRKCGIIAHDDDATSYLFDMAKDMYESLPPELQPIRQKDNRKQLKFARKYSDDNASLGIRSDILVQTGGSKTLGRSKTYHDMHISELAWWDNAQVNFYGMMYTLVDEPGSEVVIESTANGYEFFKDMWDAAQLKGKPGWNYFTPVFLSWLDMPSYRKPLQAGFDERLNEEEARMVSLGADLEQINWHRWILGTKCDGSYDKWHQECPTEATDAFLATGVKVFPVNGLKRQEETVIEPRRGSLSVIIPNKVYEFTPANFGDLWVLEEPKEGFCYCNGNDVAENRVVIDRETDKSVSVMIRRGLLDSYWDNVYERTKGAPQARDYIGDYKRPAIVAVWRGKIDTDEFAVLIENFCRWYNGAWTNVENNAVGVGVIDVLKRTYPRILNEYSFKGQEKKTTRNLGYRTLGGKSGSKSVLISNLVTAVCGEVDEITGLRGEQLLDVFFQQILDEYWTFAVKDSRMEAEAGKFDDLVIGSGLAWFTHLEAPMSRPFNMGKRKKVKYQPRCLVTGY